MKYIPYDLAINDVQIGEASKSNKMATQALVRPTCNE